MARGPAMEDVDAHFVDATSAQDALTERCVEDLSGEIGIARDSKELVEGLVASEHPRKAPSIEPPIEGPSRFDVELGRADRRRDTGREHQNFMAVACEVLEEWNAVDEAVVIDEHEELPSMFANHDARSMGRLALDALELFDLDFANEAAEKALCDGQRLTQPLEDDGDGLSGCLAFGMGRNERAARLGMHGELHFTIEGGERVFVGGGDGHELVERTRLRGQKRWLSESRELPRQLRGVREAPKRREDALLPPLELLGQFRDARPSRVQVVPVPHRVRV